MYQIAGHEQRDVCPPESLRVRSDDRIRRFSWATLALLTSATLAMARVLVPDPLGYGTHMQLGLPPCGFHFLLHKPCPLCGLTTSFAYMARLELTSAAMSHPLGPPLFVLVALAVPACAWACLRAMPIVETIDRFRLQRGALLLVLFIALVWVVRLMHPLLYPALAHPHAQLMLTLAQVTT